MDLIISNCKYVLSIKTSKLNPNMKFTIKQYDKNIRINYI